MPRYWFLYLLLATVAHGQIEGKFALSKTRFAAGEPIWLTFDMTNTGTDTLYFNAGSPYSFCGGYQLEVTQGKPVQHPSCNTSLKKDMWWFVILRLLRKLHLGCVAQN